MDQKEEQEDENVDVVVKQRQKRRVEALVPTEGFAQEQQPFVAPPWHAFLDEANAIESLPLPRLRQTVVEALNSHLVAQHNW